MRARARDGGKSRREGRVSATALYCMERGDSLQGGEREEERKYECEGRQRRHEPCERATTTSDEQEGLLTFTLIRLSQSRQPARSDLLAYSSPSAVPPTRSSPRRSLSHPGRPSSASSTRSLATASPATVSSHSHATSLSSISGRVPDAHGWLERALGSQLRRAPPRSRRWGGWMSLHR